MRKTLPKEFGCGDTHVCGCGWLKVVCKMLDSATRCNEGSGTGGHTLELLGNIIIGRWGGRDTTD